MIFVSKIKKKLEILEFIQEKACLENKMVNYSQTKDAKIFMNMFCFK